MTSYALSGSAATDPNVEHYGTWRYHSGGSASLVLSTVTDSPGSSSPWAGQSVRGIGTTRIGLRRQSDGLQVAVAEWLPGATGARGLGTLPAGNYAVNFNFAKTDPYSSPYNLVTYVYWTGTLGLSGSAV